MTGAPAARILVLEDRPNDRLYLTTVLGYAGFIVREAANGEEGLALAMTERPDLVISDVLMPKMDGYEFVRKLRKTASGADVPVIFYTATYHELDARALAEECGVVEVLLKPSEPDAILARVNAALLRDKIAPRDIPDEAFDRRHLQVTTQKLLDKVHDLEASEGRMAALVQIGQQFTAERDPVTLLNRICETVREATAARQSMVGLLADDQRRLTLVLSSGPESEAAAQLESMPELPPPMRQVVSERRSLRGRNPGGRSQHLPRPVEASSFMLAPMMSRDRVVGVIALTNKIGADEFNDADEQLATTLGIQAGIAYENALLINQLGAQTEALQEREAVTEFALNAAGIGIYERDIATGAIRVSRGVRQLLGVDPDLDLEDISTAFAEGDRRRIRDILEAAMKTGGDFNFDFTVEKTSKPRFIQARGQFEADAGGKPKRLLSVLIDLSERRELEIQLRQAQKMEAIGQLAGGIAHDFNNLLTVIQGYSRFLLESARDDEQRSDAKALSEAGERAVGLTRQLLSFSRKQARHLAVFDLNVLIDDLAEMLRRLMGEHIQLVTTLAPGTGSIRDDRGQIEQILMNLVVNARDAMPLGGDITIATRRETVDAREWVRLEVRDSGTGMSEETKARIFEPFFTTKPEGKGTGLGLATVFSIVSQAGGRIEVETVLGQGTGFVVFLPAVRESVTSQGQPIAAPRTGTESILVVEDDDSVRAMIETVLGRAGYTVRSAANVALALALPLLDCALVISDVLMPGGTGPEVVASMRSRSPGLRALYVSGYAPETTLDVSSFDERTHFLQKPFTPEILLHKIREVLDR